MSLGAGFGLGLGTGFGGAVEMIFGVGRDVAGTGLTAGLGIVAAAGVFAGAAALAAVDGVAGARVRVRWGVAESSASPVLEPSELGAVVGTTTASSSPGWFASTDPQPARQASVRANPADAHVVRRVTALSFLSRPEPSDMSGLASLPPTTKPRAPTMPSGRLLVGRRFAAGRSAGPALWPGRVRAAT